MDKYGVLKYIEGSGLPADVKGYFAKVVGRNYRSALRAGLKRNPAALIRNIDRLLGTGSGILGCSKEEALFITGFNKNDMAPERFEAALAEIRAVVFLHREGFCNLRLIRQNGCTSADISGTRGNQNYVFEVCCLQADNNVNPVDYLGLKYDKKKRQLNSARKKYKCERGGLIFAARPDVFEGFAHKAGLRDLAVGLYSKKNNPPFTHICLLSGDKGSVFPEWDGRARREGAEFDFGLPLKDAVRRRGLVFSKKGSALIAEAAGRLRGLYKKRVRAVKLVGSRARGDARPDSDWDFLVFLDACDYKTELPKLGVINRELAEKYKLGEISISPLDREKFSAIETKYPGIHEKFRKDAVNL